MTTIVYVYLRTTALPWPHSRIPGTGVAWQCLDSWVAKYLKYRDFIYEEQRCKALEKR